jgi:hypothetical protein
LAETIWHQVFSFAQALEGGRSVKTAGKVQGSSSRATQGIGARIAWRKTTPIYFKLRLATNFAIFNFSWKL